MLKKHFTVLGRLIYVSLFGAKCRKGFIEILSAWLWNIPLLDFTGKKMHNLKVTASRFRHSS